MALSNHRILKCEAGQVTIRYRESDTRRWKSCTLSAEEFIRRFLQHVLPKGFQKVRYYGLFSSGQRHRLAQARQLLSLTAAIESTDRNEATARSASNPPVMRCPTCGRPMCTVR